MPKSTTVVTAREVREFFRAEPKRMARLSTEAAATVSAGARGRLHPEVIAEHNKRRNGRTYVLGASGEAVAERKAAREALRASGVKVGLRGPLSKEALAQSKA